MSSKFSDALIDEAEAAIKSEQSYQLSKGEQTLDAIGEKVLAVSGSSSASIVQGVVPVASAEFPVVKDRVSNFVENSKILLRVLDEVGKAHPFIQAALVIFKVGIQLEITRRQCDEKVLALNTTMCDMMSVLKLLRQIITPGERVVDGLTIEQRLSTRMGLIISSIKGCAQLCDSYQRRHVALKFLTSGKWQSKFTDMAQQFVEHQNALQFGLQMYISIQITSVNETLLTLNKNVAGMMEMVFSRMQSPEERELADLIKNNGGATTPPDDKLLQEVMKNVRQQQKEDKDKKSSKDKESSKEKKSSKGSMESDFLGDLTSFKKELNKEIDDILVANEKVFERAFGAIEISLKEVKGTIVHETDRAIETILAGVSPQERIVDSDLYHIWREMGWRGSVKISHLVMAVDDHFCAKSNVAINEIHVIANEPNPSSPMESLRDIASIAQHAIPDTPAEDLWSLRYITVHRAQPLIEALGDDGSSFITVSKLNAFTASRPKGWSLPRWIAYWTVGFEMTTQWYYRRIRRLFSLLSDSSRDVLPANRKVVSQFMDSWSIHATEDLLAGCRNVSYWDGTDWAHDSLFLKFKPWVLESEKRMDTYLRRLVYNIDQDNTLNIVTEGGRPETYVMPLLYLLMERSHSVVKRACNVVLHSEELNVLHYSMGSVHRAIYDRVEKLQAIYKLHNVQKEQKLQTIFFGLYAHTFEPPAKGEFWMQDPDQYDAIPDEPPRDLDIPEPELFYGPQIEELDLDPSSRKNSDSDLPNGDTNEGESVPVTPASQSLVGAWSGTCKSLPMFANTDDGPVSFSITRHTSDDRFHCSGTDTWGPFTVNGCVDGEHITFLQEYEELQNGMKVSLQFKGQLNEERDRISGKWGPPLPDADESPASGDSGDVQTEPGEQEEAVKKRQDGEEVGDTPPSTNIRPATPKGADRDITREDYVSETGSAPATVSKDATETWTPHGTFVLYRRSVDYTLCRPSDEEFQKNKPHALWRFVRNVVKYQFRTHHLTSGGIKERRNKRQMHWELWLKKSEYGTFADPTDESKWTELISAVHPDDLHLWNNIAQFKIRREPVHPSTYCDHCQEMLELRSRIMCIECSEGEFYSTIDLCPNCQTESVYREKDNKDHKPSHPMIQLRWIRSRLETNSVMSYAKSRLDALSDEAVKRCTYCEKQLPERLYWYCTQCEGDIFVCIECNNGFEKKKPWILERKAVSRESHHWLHTMVLQPQAAGESEPCLSSDERLAKMEAGLDFVTVRLHKLEELLERVISVVTQATKNLDS